MADKTPIALALGANIGDKLAALRAAVDAVSPFVTVTKVSPVYESVPLYVDDQPDFFNATLIGETDVPPHELLAKIKQAEQDVGRRPTFRYGPRVIDIDILFYGDQVVALPDLNIPHLLMAERDFVLLPLADIAADWVHPQTGRTVAQMAAALADRGIRKTELTL